MGVGVCWRHLGEEAGTKTKTKALAGQDVRVEGLQTGVLLTHESSAFLVNTTFEDNEIGLCLAHTAQARVHACTFVNNGAALSASPLSCTVGQDNEVRAYVDACRHMLTYADIC